MKPSSSSAAMSLRTVAGLTPRLCRSARFLDPTGSFVETKSSTMARNTSSLRSSSTRHLPLALTSYECQVYGDSPRVGTRSAPGRMRRVKRLVIALVALLVVAGLAGGGWAVFEHFERADKIKDAKKACSGLDTVDPAATLPAGLSLPAGQTLMRVETQGKTSVVFASTTGTRDDLVDIRNSTVDALKAQGYTLKHTDQEPTFEADAAVSKGDTDDSINVRPLCTGKAVVRYTLH